MAEALAVIAIIANFVALVDMGNKVVTRLHEYGDTSRRLPKVFQGIVVDLPLVLDTVNRSVAQARSGTVSPATLEKLQPIVDRCKSLIEDLDVILSKLLPNKDDSLWRRGKKTVWSLAQEKDVKDIALEIQKLVWTLTYYQSATGPISNEQLPIGPEVASTTANHTSQASTHIRSTQLSYRREAFIGREEILASLARSLCLPDQHCRAVLSGLGGIGKTCIALETARLFQKEFFSVFWIHASSVARFEKGYIEIMKNNGISGWDESQTRPMLNSGVDGAMMVLVKSWLEGQASGQWLLILDNADDYEMFYGPTRFADYLPSSEKGSILMTTRNSKVGLNFISAVDSVQTCTIEVTPFDTHEISQFFMNKFGSDRSEDEFAAYDALATELSNVPLALTQAAAFILSNRISIRDYLTMYQSNESNKIRLLSADFEDAGRDLENRNPIATTYAISFEHLRKHHHLAAELLARMCVLDPQGVPETLVSLGINPVDVAIALGTLQAFSLISNRTDKTLNIRRTVRVFDIHRLVYTAMRSWLASEELLVPRTAKAIKILNSRLSRIRWENKDIWSTYLPHATKLLSDNRVDDLLPGRAFMKRALRLATYEAKQVQPLEIENFAGRHIKKLHATEDDMCPACCAVLHYKASACFQIEGNYALALTHAEEAFVLRNFTLGTSHMDTISSMVQVVQLLTEEGGSTVLRGAVTLGKQAVTESGHFGDDHFLHLESMLSLASALRKQGQYKQALELGKKVLSTHLSQYGQSDARTWESMTNLASTYACLQKDSEALDLVEIVAQKRAEFLGPEHPQTLLSVTNLAAMYSKIGDRSTAAMLQIKNLVARRKVSTDEHPETLRCMANLATTCTALGAFRKAEKLYTEVLELRRKVLGCLHPDTLTSMANLGRLYMKQQKWQLAKEMFESAVQGSTMKLGETHQDTIRRKMKLQICVREINSTSIIGTSGQNQEAHNSARDRTRSKVNLRTLNMRRCLIAMASPVAAILDVDYLLQARLTSRLFLTGARRVIGICIPIVFFLDAVYEGRKGWLQTDYYWPSLDCSEWASVNSGGPSVDHSEWASVNSGGRVLPTNRPDGQDSEPNSINSD